MKTASRSPYHNLRKETSSTFNNVKQSSSEENGDGEKASAIVDEYLILLLDPKNTESCTKSYLQEVLTLYTRELPTMNYAANTGKLPNFIETCMSNGKYCALLLRSPITNDSEEVLAAITYQIVPADTWYASIPVAAVSSAYQHKGLGGYFCMELRKRLRDVDIQTIFCFGDKQSEGFWVKQGFISLAEVDGKGRAVWLPIKTYSQITNPSVWVHPEASATAGSLRACFRLKPYVRVLIPKNC